MILSIPLVAMQFSDEWNWGLLDFVACGAMLFGTGLAYQFMTAKGGAAGYRVAVGFACLATVLLLWVNGAVGIIGDGPVNLMYFGVVAVLITGVVIARLQPHGMARALLATAIAQMLLPVMALVIWNPPFSPGVAPVMALNAGFAALWLASAWLLRCAGSGRPDGPSTA